MSYNRENYVRIRREFEKKHMEAKEEAIRRTDELHMKYPKLQEIDTELSKIGMKIFEETLKGREGLEKRLDMVKKEHTVWLNERKTFLAQNGYPENYTDVRYECPLCQDTGVDGKSMCACMKRALIQAGYESSGIGNLIRTQSFESFDLSYYLDTGNKEIYQRMALMFEFCKNYAQNFDPQRSESLLLCGKTGLGKTHISTSVAKIIIEKGYDVVYDSAQNIFSDFENERFRSGYQYNNDSSQSDTRRYLECDLLIMDDLGTEMSSTFTVACLYNIINTRINCTRPTIINTNLSREELKKRYQDRITSRLFGEFSTLQFYGTDIREQKLKV